MAISDEFIQTADVLFCTLSCAGNASVARNFRNIDLLVIDEAAQAFEPELLVPMALLPKNLVLLGDPMQLPATVMSQEIRRLGLDRSVMQRLVVGCRHPFCLLDTQYRMHPAIARFSSRHFYGGLVRDAESVSARDSILPCVGVGGYRVPGWLAGNCSFLDIEGTEQRGNRMGRSLENLQEAQFVAHLVRYLRDQWALNLARQVCVITFYAAQVQRIQECLAALGLGGGQVQVLSVDSFQGSECDCVILSFVRSNAHGDVGFVKEFRRLNVALTRARRLMLSVGSARTLESFGTHNLGKGVAMNPQGVKSDSVVVQSAEGGVDLAALREMMGDLRRRNRVFSGSEALCDFNSSVLQW
jgi:senataxin